MQKEVAKAEEVRLGIDTAKLEAEQLRLAKQLQLKDAVELSAAETVAGCDNSYLGKQIISAIAILDLNMEILEERFFIGRITFPYIPGFLAYREMPAMLNCYAKLEQKPDVLLVDGNGILHPRKLGLASHFGLAVQKPTIGIAKSLLIGQVKAGKVYIGKEIRGAELATKKGGRPIYISPGNMIGLDSALELVKKFIRPPHKLPEPLDAAHRLAAKVKAELEGGK